MQKLLPLCAVLAWAGTARAQQGAFHYGVKGGFSLGTYAGQLDGPLPAGYKPGFAAGVLASYGLAPHLALQAEVLYSQKGVFVDDYPFELNTTSPHFNHWRYRATLSYLDVPVLLKLSTQANGRGLFVEAGPQLSIALGQHEYLSAFGQTGNYPNPPDQDPVYDSAPLVPVGVGYVGGIGYQFGFGLGLGLRYTADFTHVYQQVGLPGASGIAFTNNFHNSVFQVQAHYVLGGLK